MLSEHYPTIVVILVTVIILFVGTDSLTFSVGRKLSKAEVVQMGETLSPTTQQQKQTQELDEVEKSPRKLFHKELAPAKAELNALEELKAAQATEAEKSMEPLQQKQKELDAAKAELAALEKLKAAQVTPAQATVTEKPMQKQKELDAAKAELDALEKLALSTTPAPIVSATTTGPPSMPEALVTDKTCGYLFFKIFKCIRGPMLAGERTHIVAAALVNTTLQMCRKDTAGAAGTTLLDIGANDGQETTMLRDTYVKQCEAPVRILVFEPNAKYIPALQNITPAAVVVNAFAGADADHGKSASLGGDGQRGFMGEAGSGSIPIQSITRVLASRNLSTHLLVVKVDAEGADGLVLNTLLSLIKDQDTLVMYELSNWWEKHTPVVSPAATINALEGVGYDVYLFGSSDKAAPQHFFLRVSAEEMKTVTPWLRWETGVALKRNGATQKALRPLRGDELVALVRRGGALRRLPQCKTYLKSSKSLIKCFHGRFFTVDAL